MFCDGGVGRWDLPGGDLAELRSSLERLEQLELRNMYPGHGSYAEGDAPQHLRHGQGVHSRGLLMKVIKCADRKSGCKKCDLSEKELDEIVGGAQGR